MQFFDARAAEILEVFEYAQETLRLRSRPTRDAQMTAELCGGVECISFHDVRLYGQSRPPQLIEYRSGFRTVMAIGSLEGGNHKRVGSAPCHE